MVTEEYWVWLARDIASQDSDKDKRIMFQQGLRKTLERIGADPLIQMCRIIARDAVELLLYLRSKRFA